MLKKIIAGLGFIFLIFIAIAAVKPEDYLIKREILIKTKPEALFTYLVSAKKADQWMPWKETDPQVEMSYSGPDEGIGSTSSWESPGQMGTGKAEVYEVIPNRSVKTKITYSKPMQMTQDSEFSITTQGDNTLMTWSVSGKQPFFARLMCTLMFMNMDKYVGGMFEKGLNSLKSLVESK